MKITSKLKMNRSNFFRLATMALLVGLTAFTANGSSSAFVNAAFPAVNGVGSSFYTPFSVLVVNTTLDTVDQIPGDGVCDDGFGNCSLRAAIDEANAFPGANNIDFNIGGGCSQNIQPASALPAITETVTINGYSQPGALPNTLTIGSNATICITLNGASVGGFTDGLSVNAVNTVIRGLNIIRWTDAGIEVGTGNGSVIEGNFIGAAGAANRIGVSILANNVKVGGSTLLSRNIITGNTRFGISMTEPSANNVIQNNYVGLNQNSGAAGNGESGISIFRSSNNTVGGTSTSVRNVISSNGVLTPGGTDGSGISLLGDIVGQSSGNVIQGNYIGTNPTGATASGNTNHGIRIFGAANNTIGGAATGAGNLISGNALDGINMTGAGATGNSVLGNTIGLDVTLANDVGNSREGVSINDVAGNAIGGANSGEGNWIAGNNEFGILINGAGGTGNTIRGNKIGFNSSGASRPQLDGIRILSNNNTVGGTTTAERNFIGGHTQFGIAVAFATGNVIKGNYIGLTNTGAALGNVNGVFIQDASSNTVGGTAAGAGNVISANSFGVRIIFISTPTTNNLVLGNLIGTDPTGTTAIGNNTTGVLVQGGSSNTIGGTTSAARNIISGNGQGVSLQNDTTNNLVLGNYIGTKADGLSALPNLTGVNISSSLTSGNVIGGTATGAGNVISGNGQTGIQVSGLANNNRFEGNIIGLKADGSAALANANGVSLFDRASANIIGGTAANAGNVISGNINSGVILNDGANNNRVEGNKIGTDASGIIAQPNGLNGIRLLQGGTLGVDTISNTIGGTTAAARNIVSGNIGGGVYITGSTTSYNTIAGNYIGTNAAGDNYIANGQYGVRIESPGNTVGGATTAHRNVISGQFQPADYGLLITSSASGTLVQNNYLGTNAAGDGYIFNGTNIYALGSGFTIDSNLISGAFYGISVGSVSFGYITNNKIGTNAAGTGLLGNGYGVALNGAQFVRVGEDSNGNPAPNVIAGGTRDGILVLAGTGNTIRQNSIYDNAGVGIDLGGDGITQNDPGDTDLANNLQNFPVINSVTTTIDGTLNSSANQIYRIEFFNSTTADPTGYGEGKTFLTSTIVGTDVLGNASFSVPNPVAIGGYISATATNITTLDTSEFSAIKQVLAPTAVTFNGGKATHFPGRGNLVEWQTGLESNNLGFNVYRETNGKRDLVTPNLVAGSALLTNASLRSEQNYTWFDENAPSDATYSIESVDLSGQRDLSPGFSATISSGPVPESMNSPTFREINDGVGGTTFDVETYAKAATPNADQTAIQSILARSAGAKISVRNAGYYRVTAADLLANGMPQGSDPRFLRVFADGVEQPITVNDNDGRFDQGDSIEFYGIGADTPETAEHIYYVTASAEMGKRIEIKDLVADPSNASTFISTVERKDRSIYVANILNRDEENFFGSVVNSTGVDQTIDLPDPASGSQAEIFVSLQGITRNEHHVRVELNGRSVATVDFNQMAKGEVRVSVDPSELRNGPNIIRLTSFTGSDVSVVDRIQVRYPRALKAVNGTLRFTSNGGQSVMVGGFTRKGTRMFDITDHANPVELAVRSVREADPTGNSRTFAATAVPVGSGTRSVVAIADAATGVTLTPNYASSLSSGRGADLVIITKHEFADAFGPLAAKRQAQGLKVMIVDVDDIYDEYNFGSKSSAAIRQFLAQAFGSWRIKPQYVLFGGDASYDQKGYFGNSDTLQTKLVDTLSMETASDEWFGDLNDDGVAEMAIGRLPAANVEQMNAMVAKVIAYDQQTPSTSAAFVADLSDGFDFANVNNAAKQVLPTSMSAAEFVRDGSNDATLRDDLISAINSGQRLVSYVGHGSASIWRGNIFTRSDAAALSNRGRLSVFLAMTCLNGFSHHVSADSLAETLLKNPNGGAVAVWASSGTTLPDSYEAITREIHTSLIAGQTLGQAHLRAKRTVTNSEVRQTWMLLGDPSMKLR